MMAKLENKRGRELVRSASLVHSAPSITAFGITDHVNLGKDAFLVSHGVR
jgi:hypothetical protein